MRVPALWPATVRCTARSKPSHTQIACALATWRESRTRSAKSSSDTARPNVRTVVGAFVARVLHRSGSAPPCAASGLTTSFSPGGRSSADVSVRARTRPATPAPVRYVAVMLPAPVGTGAPVRPSPNWIAVVPSSCTRLAKTCASGPSPYRPGASSQRTPLTDTSRLGRSAPAAALGTKVSGAFFSAKRGNGAERVAAADDLAADALAVACRGDVAEQVGARHVQIERVVEREVDAQVLRDLRADRPGQHDDALAGDEHATSAKPEAGSAAASARCSSAASAASVAAVLRATVRGPTGPIVTATWGDGALSTGGAGSGATRRGHAPRRRGRGRVRGRGPSSRRPARA